jgi:hypothetical protein
MGDYQAMICGEGDCVLGSYRAGYKASEYNGEDGRVNNEFHKLVTSGDNASY